MINFYITNYLFWLQDTEEVESNEYNSDVVDHVEVDASGAEMDPPVVIRHHVEVPLGRCPLNEEGLALLRAQVDPTFVTLDNLIDSYLRVKSFVTHLLLQ